jgi:hypothetical protein
LFFFTAEPVFAYLFLFFFISFWFAFCQASRVRELKISFTPTHTTCDLIGDKTNQNLSRTASIRSCFVTVTLHKAQPNSTLHSRAQSLCRRPRLKSGTSSFDCGGPASAPTSPAIHGPSQVELLLTVTVTTLPLLCRPSIKPTVLFKVAIASALIPANFL